MNDDFQRILITGASSGIGADTARQLAAAGHKVFLTGQTPEKLAAISEETGSPSLAADLTTPGKAKQVVDAAIEELGGLDAVVHSCGVGLIKPFLETSDAEFVRVTNINIRSTFLVAQAACGHFVQEKKGRFITFPGILGKATMKGASAYITSKYAVTGLIRSLATEFGRANIGFTLFHFGGVDTPFWDELDMNPQRDMMISSELAANQVVAALNAPNHLVVNELTFQPMGHQLGL